MFFIALLMMVSLDWGRSCDVVKYKFKQYGLDKTGGGCKKGCVRDGYDTDDDDIPMKCKECEAVDNEENCSSGYYTCNWRNKKCVSSSCPSLNARQRCRWDEREGEWSNGKCQNKKTCQELCDDKWKSRYDTSEECLYKCNHPSRSCSEPYQYTVEDRKYAHKVLGCLYDSQYGISSWAVWAVPTVIIACLVVVIVIVVVIVCCIWVRKKKYTPMPATPMNQYDPAPANGPSSTPMNQYNPAPANGPSSTPMNQYNPAPTNGPSYPNSAPTNNPYDQNPALVNNPYNPNPAPTNNVYNPNPAPLGGLYNQAPPNQPYNPTPANGPFNQAPANESYNPAFGNAF